jgi:hypothetical protein
VGYVDVDGNGILAPSEVQLADTSVYVGQPIPKSELSMHTTFALFQGRLSFMSAFSFQDGLTQLNEAFRYQCSQGRCRMVVDRATSLKDQAVGLSMSGALSSYYAAYETVSWLRWNSASMTLRAPQSITRMVRSNAGSISLMGRNLWLWSKYRGADPEVNSTNTGNHTRDIGGVPQTRDWSIRVNLNY